MFKQGSNVFSWINLSMRSRGSVTDHPISLTNWLDTFLGKDTHGAITVIDLSLVPNEIIHLVTAVISRVTFEALQRYRKMNGKPLPIVMVAEEAHTFIKRYKEESESQSVSDVCSKYLKKSLVKGVNLV